MSYRSSLPWLLDFFKTCFSCVSFSWPLFKIQQKDLFQFHLKTIGVCLSAASAGAGLGPNSVKESTSQSFQSILWVSGSWTSLNGRGRQTMREMVPWRFEGICICVCLREHVGERAMSWYGIYVSCPVWQRHARTRRQRARCAGDGTGDGTASLCQVRVTGGSPASTELGNEGLETRNHHTAAKCKPTCIREIQALVNTWWWRLSLCCLCKASSKYSVLGPSTREVDFIRFGVVFFLSYYGADVYVMLKKKSYL